MSGFKGMPNRGKFRSWADGPRPRYTGPDLIGKQIKAPPYGVGPQWVGKAVTIERRVPRGHVDHLPASDNVGA